MKPAEIFYTRRAEDDLTSVFDYIAEKNPENALNYIDKIQEEIENLSRLPFIGVDCRNKGIERDCRILIFENYLIFYEYDKTTNEITILRILHGSRKYQNLLK